MTTPSTGTFSPGRTRSRSPTRDQLERDVLLAAVVAARAARFWAPDRAARGSRREVLRARAQFQHLAEQHQHGDDGGGLEIDRDARRACRGTRRERVAGREHARPRCRRRRRRCPCAISVNMLRLRVRSDCAPRTKNGQPAQSTTGVASTNWIQFDTRRRDQCMQAEMAAHLERERPARSAPARSRTAGVMSTSSGSGAVVRATPSPARAPCRRSGRRRVRPGAFPDASGRCRSCRQAAPQLRRRSGLGAGRQRRGFLVQIFVRDRRRICCGSRPSRRIVRPWWRADAVLAGSTFMPQTGSIAVPPMRVRGTRERTVP